MKFLTANFEMLAMRRWFCLVHKQQTPPEESHDIGLHSKRNDGNEHETPYNLDIGWSTLQFWLPLLEATFLRKHTTAATSPFCFACLEYLKDPCRRPDALAPGHKQSRKRAMSQNPSVERWFETTSGKSINWSLSKEVEKILPSYEP